MSTSNGSQIVNDDRAPSAFYLVLARISTSMDDAQDCC
jgi:hypothetical protein